jgi:K+/H+ antiporter YhaU regulatory subunit KhtT
LRAKGYRGIRDSASHPIETTILETLKQVNVQWIEIPDDYQSDRSLASLQSEETALSTVLAVHRDGQTRANPEASFVFQSRDRVLISGNAESVESVTRLLRGD